MELTSDDQDEEDERRSLHDGQCGRVTLTWSPWVRRGGSCPRHRRMTSEGQPASRRRLVSRCAIKRRLCTNVLPSLHSYSPFPLPPPLPPSFLPSFLPSIHPSFLPFFLFDIILSPAASFLLAREQFCFLPFSIVPHIHLYIIFFNGVGVDGDFFFYNVLFCLVFVCV